MATQTQLRRGTAAQNNSFTGAVGELSYDTENKSVRVHDGSTAGGIEVITEAHTGGATITTGDNTAQLTLISTDADAAVGPTVQLFRNSSSPADNDLAGNLLFVAENDASEATVYANLGAHLQDVTNGTEDGKFFINTMVAGAEKNRLFMISTETVFNEESADLDFRVESNGNANMLFVDGGNNAVGIGTSSPSAPIEAVGTTDILQLTGESGNAFARFTDSDASSDFSIGADDSSGAGAGAFVFYDRNNSAYRMRIDSEGSVLLGVTSQIASSNAVLHISADAVATSAGSIMSSCAATSTVYHVHFRNGNGGVGGISTNGSSTAYVTSSDYRLKTDAQPMTGASDRVLALNPVNFEWITDGTRVDGFLAHEAQAVVPESVTGTKDGMMDEEYQVSAATGDIYTAGVEAGFNEVSAAIEASPAYYDVDGNIIKAEVIAQAAVHEAYDAVDEVIHSADVEQPETLEDGQQWRETTPEVIGTRSVPDMQGIDQSKMVPLLVASLQEALTEITALKTRVAALEAG